MEGKNRIFYCGDFFFFFVSQARVRRALRVEICSFQFNLFMNCDSEKWWGIRHSMCPLIVPSEVTSKATASIMTLFRCVDARRCYCVVIVNFTTKTTKSETVFPFPGINFSRSSKVQRQAFSRRATRKWQSQKKKKINNKTNETEKRRWKKKRNGTMRPQR